MESKSEQMNFNYREVSCAKSVAGADFVRGLQDYNFSFGAPAAFIPKHSYFKISLEVKGRNGAPVTPADGVALADDAPGALFNNCYFRLAGQDISVLSNYVAQGSILRKRIGKANAWQKSAGLSAMMLDADFAKRWSKTSYAPLLENNKKVILPITGVEVKSDVVPTVTIENNTVVGVGTKFETILTNQGNLNAGLVQNTNIIIRGRPYLVKTCADETNLTILNSAEAKEAGVGGAYFVCESPTAGDAKTTLDLIYTPPLGIFDLADEKPEDEVLVGDFRISLNPNTNYVSSVIECLRLGVPSTDANAAASPIDSGYYGVAVTDIKFYAAYCLMNIDYSVPKQMSLSEMMIMSKPLTQSNTYEFSVPSSTTAIAVWFQSPQVGNNPLYPPSKFKMFEDRQNKLSGFQITYANQSMPSTKWTSSFGLNNNQLIQRYRDNMYENTLLSSEGGCESIGDFLERGLYIIYNFIKDKDDRSTQCQVSVDFSGPVETNSSIYLCAIYDRQTEITVTNGNVTSIRQLN
jgi:hypothetical protein